MLYSSIGYYSLIFGLIISLPIFFFSIRNFRNEEVLDYKIITFSFIQLFLVVISFLGLIFSFIHSDFSNETVF
ncbi:heme lyase CcmF/NrfE family subunit, partial [Candidatus Pelagibacter sp.]|nr:heme lyase CcmF/NrfE family subunit [Candidatus Pelagibacter sp.]